MRRTRVASAAVGLAVLLCLGTCLATRTSIRLNTEKADDGTLAPEKPAQKQKLPGSEPIVLSNNKTRNEELTTTFHTAEQAVDPNQAVPVALTSIRNMNSELSEENTTPLPEQVAPTNPTDVPTPEEVLRTLEAGKNDGTTPLPELQGLPELKHYPRNESAAAMPEQQQEASEASKVFSPVGADGLTDDQRAARNARIAAQQYQQRLEQHEQQQKAIDKLFELQKLRQRAEEAQKKEQSDWDANAEKRLDSLQGAPEPGDDQKLAALKQEVEQEGKPINATNTTATENSEQTTTQKPVVDLAALGMTPPNDVIPWDPSKKSTPEELLARLPSMSWMGKRPPNDVLDPDLSNVYDYRSGALDWNGACQTGMMQSPILINSATASKGNGIITAGDTMLELHYRRAGLGTLKMWHMGQLLRVPAEDKLGYVASGLKKSPYDVMQIDFHAPSEHAFDYAPKSKDYHFDMEMQIWHQKRRSTDVGTPLLAISVLFNVTDDDNLWLNQAMDWDQLPHSAHSAHVLSYFVDLALSDGSEMWRAPYFSYLGSMTQPPCEEGVSWRVLQHPVTISAKQLKKINSLFLNNPDFAGGNVGNNRPIQKTHNRLVTVSV